MTSRQRPGRGFSLAPALAAGAAFFVLACSDGPVVPQADFDLQPFQDLARNATCAEQRNELFLIDGELIFWNRVGDCADASFCEQLFGMEPADLQCGHCDNIAGPWLECWDATHEDLFLIIIENLDEPDLGLGPGHVVEPIPF